MQTSVNTTEGDFVVNGVR